MAKSKRGSTDPEQKKLAPLFAKLLVSHFPKGTVSNQENDTVETKKYPNDNADMSHVPGDLQHLGTHITRKSTDTIFVTLKYPSDKDEFMTLKWPSDCDEDLCSHRSFLTASASEEKPITLKYPSDKDELTC